MKTNLLLSMLCAASLFTTARGAQGAAKPVTLENFKLVGDLSSEQSAFTLTATARVEDSKGGSVELLAGALALTEVGPHPKWHLRVESNRYILVFERGGRFPIELKFDAAVKQTDAWRALDFCVAPGVLQPIVLRGLGPDAKFEFAGAARPERRGNEFVSYLPSDGVVKLSWKEARPEAEGKLFYSAEMLSQISVSPGLMRQIALLDCKVMQGELSRVAVQLRGAGEITRVQGDQVLAWNVEAGQNSDERRLIVQFNQPQKEQFSFQVQVQTPLGAFPQTVDAVQVRPEGATRFVGYFRVVNEGAVRLEVAPLSGLSQISPEQFPESDATHSLMRPSGSQRFAYRFSGAGFALRISADQVLPELGVSEVLGYHLGESELAIDAELELDIREAPLRELVLRIPRGYVVARLTASGMNDYFVREPADEPDTELRLVYGTPISGRQVVQLRLERNQPLAEAAWALSRIDVPKAKSVRGHIGVAADAGFRLTTERTQGLTEIATAFFPGKLPGIQAAFRLSDWAWQATLRVERLPQTVQADVLHLFSIGEGIAYGSSLLNYVVSGAPVSAFKIELSDEYFNVEFTGKEIRNWQKTDGGYVVQLHTPVSGAYTLLATYERPFKAQGETLAFTGARSLDAQSEQGHTLIISAYQFRVEPSDVSPGLIALETGEVPPEYRLFFDAPILKAYRYTSRPFNLKLALSPLAQGDSISQVVDRATLTTRISKEGQAITDVRYFVKSRGNPNFRLALPEGLQLWSVAVNGAPVVPVTDAKENLIPLPQRADPNAVLTIDLKLAAQAKDARYVNVSAPKVNAPVMLAAWKLEPDTGQRLMYRRGSLTPIGGVLDVSGFAGLARVFSGDSGGNAGMLTLASLVLVGAGLTLWRWASGAGVFKYSARHIGGALLGTAAVVFALVMLARLGHLAEEQKGFLPRELSFLAPVQQAGSALSIEVANVADKLSAAALLGFGWPVLLAVAAWGYAWVNENGRVRTAAGLAGWLLVAWAALRLPNGVGIFLMVLAAYLLCQVVIPAFRRLSHLPPKPEAAPSPNAANGAAPATAAFLLGGLIWLNLTGMATAGSADLAESVIQDVRIEDKFALGTAKIRWQAEKGQVLPLLFEPAVLTGLNYPSNALKLVTSDPGPTKRDAQATRTQQLLAEKRGVFDVELRYEIQVAKRSDETGFALPVPAGLVNQLSLTVLNLDVDVLSAQAVSVRRDLAGSNTVAALALAPASDIWIGWKPRSRDVKREKPVFYAEVTQLYVPAAGVIEGVHQVSVRPAQGEVSELVFDVPAGATITDVTELAKDSTSQRAPGAPDSPVALWRFDPDARKLRVTLARAQSRPFALLVRSQLPAGPLPFEHSVGLLSLDGAAGQIGLLGVATGNEVQLETVRAEAFSPINLEDFPTEAASTLQAQLPGLTVRRAFRYTNIKAAASLKVSAVEPDVRVETQGTLSLGEDRNVLAVTANAEITRAGIFKLSFVMPAGFEVESISGSALSHWTDSKTDTSRVITMHLTGKTEGQQQFAISLAGAGVKGATAWPVPQLVLREASKQRGTLLLVPEQGMRLQVSARDGVTQLDPQKSGIRQKGVLAFRLLQTPWKLALDIERVEPWIQVTSLQHATVNEAQVRVAANLQYQIENTGLKTFHVLLPTNAEGVRFQGEQVADFLPVAGGITNGAQLWEIKLHRRVIGACLLQVSYQTPVPEQAAETALRGVQAVDVNLQRGFVTVQSSGRLQVRVDGLPEALQPSEWQSIPRALQQDLQAAAADFTYRLVEPSFQLPLRLERHEAAKLLAAHVNNITLASVISDSGVMLTAVRLELVPGDKRLLSLTLPPAAKFWFAFVNQAGVWPWRDQDKILLPLEQQSRGNQTVPVELFYSCQAGAASAGALDFELLAPKFDLPLENITWRVSLSDKWRVQHWAGTLQLQQQKTVPDATVLDVQGYLQNEASSQRERTKEAEDFLAAGNNALQQGDPQQARRAFQAAYGLSMHDAAFNEDARVQLHNIKLQQALVGLNVRQAEAAGGDTGALGAQFRDLHNRKEVNYTQQDAKDIIDRNTADENSAFMRLAERLIQQQDAAVSSASPIRASVPEQGRVLLFKRSVAVDTWADLRVGLKIAPVRAASWAVRTVILGCTLALLVAFGFAARRVLSSS